MLRYIALINWTQQGISEFADTTERADQVGALAKSMAAEMTDLY